MIYKENGPESEAIKSEQDAGTVGSIYVEEISVLMLATSIKAVARPGTLKKADTNEN